MTPYDIIPRRLPLGLADSSQFDIWWKKIGGNPLYHCQATVEPHPNLALHTNIEVLQVQCNANGSEQHFGFQKCKMFTKNFIDDSGEVCTIIH